tara:strand:+ start:1861 stop:1962 length:102 start_codon:yes stop_codon:yes gene_type:complete
MTGKTNKKKREDREDRLWWKDVRARNTFYLEHL